MKKLGIAVLLSMGLTLIGCGGGNNSNNPANINGNWNATLTDAGNATVFTFGTSLIVSNDGTLSVSNFSFSTNSSCFVSGETESGSFALSGNFSGNVTGKFQFSVKSGSPGGNTLSLSGTANGNTISGTWSLTGGTGCTGSGNFMMTKG
jgi:hypothetical protein